MSYYLSDTLLRDWARENLKRYLDPREYTVVFNALHATKRSQGLSRVELGLLKIMLGDYRPERAEAEAKAYASSNAVSLVEIADELRCHVSTVRRAKARLNDMAKRSERAGQQARKHGLILFHDLGVCVRATFWDAMRANAYSEAQKAGQGVAHDANIKLAAEKNHDIKLERERVEMFKALAPEEQRRLLEQMSAQAA